MNPVEAREAMLSKWVIHTLELRDSNLQILLLKNYQPRMGGKWAFDRKWC